VPLFSKRSKVVCYLLIERIVFDLLHSVLEENIDVSYITGSDASILRQSVVSNKEIGSPCLISLVGNYFLWSVSGKSSTIIRSGISTESCGSSHEKCDVNQIDHDQMHDRRWNVLIYWMANYCLFLFSVGFNSTYRCTERFHLCQ
jgi:hypothetical protein